MVVPERGSRVPADELAEHLYREREERAAEMAEAAKTLPPPEGPEEEEILRRHGFMPDSWTLELDRTTA